MKIELTPHELMQLAHVLVERDGPEPPPVPVVRADIAQREIGEWMVRCDKIAEVSEHRRKQLEGEANATETHLGKTILRLQEDVRDLRVKRAEAFSAGEKKGEKERQLLQSKLDGTAIATDTVLGKLCDEALKLIGEWADSECHHWQSNDLRERTRALLTSPRVPSEKASNEQAIAMLAEMQMRYVSERDLASSNGVTGAAKICQRVVDDLANIRRALSGEAPRVPK